MKILIERDRVDADRTEKHGRIPLLHAASRAHEGVVKILLERDDFSPNKPDKRSRVPLLCPTSDVHGGVVKILLERDDVKPTYRMSTAELRSCMLLRIGTREWRKY